MTGDEIAVIGVAGRFPGAADVGEFWRNLCDAVDSSGAPTPGVTDFDAGFFGFDERQAIDTDPQHRMFLEVAWQAVEDSGYPPGALPLRAGVFASTSVNQYLIMRLLAGDRHHPPHQTPDHLPARVAYRLGARGPAIAVQTACSGSLVAVCLAAQSLLDYRCDLAVAGGSSVDLPGFPHPHTGLVSPDGVCRAFDRNARGAGFGSGAGAVVLRRLADAVAGGDQIRAVLRGWAVSNDGADRGGYAVPGVAGQATAVAEALAAAELSAADVGYVEGHGSGTLLGDAIEVAALRRVFGANRAFLGSVKSNIGYLDAASGIAGLLKAVLMVQHGQIPASLHFVEPNPEADFGPLVVPVKTRPWSEAAGSEEAGSEPAGSEATGTDGLRIAGVSAFGMGGTNAHVVVAEPPAARGWRTPVPGYPFQRRRYWVDGVVAP
ncbi:polyketide synthase [Actinomycetes bacterium KLBMP 9797]